MLGRNQKKGNEMMRQTRATLVTLGVAILLVAGLFMFGCNRHDGHMEEGEHMQEEASPHHESESGKSAEQSQGQTEEDETMQGEGHGHESDGSESVSKLKEPSGTVENGVRVVEVEARRFEFDPATIVVNAGETVRLKVTSQDVTHGVGIDAFGVDKKLPPNETVTVEFTADKPGTHHFHCSVYCGKGHKDMHGELVVRE